jgi:hypothetical protein
VRTRHLQLVTSEYSVTANNRSNVQSHFGPVNPASTTWLAQETLRVRQLQQLTELLNSLESVVANLNYKSSEAIDTLLIATRGVRVALYGTATESAGTDLTCDECGNDTVVEGESKCLECLESMVK